MQGYQPNDKHKRHHPSTSYGHHRGPMDVDANQKDFRPRKDKSSVTCFNCGKQGHYKRECHEPKKNGWRPVPGKEVATIEKGVPFIEVSAHDAYHNPEDAIDHESQDTQEDSTAPDNGLGDREQHDARKDTRARIAAQELALAVESGNISHQDHVTEGDASTSQRNLGNDSGASLGPSQL
ncbi:hypothetical protein C8A05DRAFT_20640 [Staphylotrichum tortipilum]|uniref:CCHC-type domain-containing protein n=1 Tax=Staphylotrichum tortipilum TaxID=2831512 RepID=A0AAN6M896_9PEZI|nr:hypothetical protein C8A05DRAFT_20640 [Staphylotrichum longicolle]